MEKVKPDGKNMIDEKPPVLKSWKQVYTVVFLNLVVLIILFYLFTKIFS